MDPLLRLLLRVLGPLRDRLTSDDLEALNAQAESISAVFDLASALHVGQRYGFYQGLLTGIHDSPFNQARLAEGTELKQALAGYCLQKVFQADLDQFQRPGPNSDGGESRRQRLFFESGTTIAFIIGRLALAIDEARQARGRADREHGLPASTPPLFPATVETNSFIGQTALAGLVEQMTPLHGHLELKYYGHLPFDDVVNTGLSPVDRAARLEEEYASFRNVRAVVGGCDRVFATCSAFSFLFGPLVGSRANCLTKTAMYAGALSGSGNGRRFYLCLHYNKIVPGVRRAVAVGATEPATAVLHRPERRCQSVFPLPQRAEIEAWADKRQRSVAGQAAEPYLFDRDWHGAVLAGKVPVAVAIKGFQADCRTFDTPVVDFSLTWLDWVCGHPGLRLLIAYPEGDKSAWALISREVTAANEVLSHLRKPVRLHLTPTDSIAVIRPEERDNR
jgi:hypothetical protein